MSRPYVGASGEMFLEEYRQIRQCATQEQAASVFCVKGDVHCFVPSSCLLPSALKAAEARIDHHEWPERDGSE
jgi:hypothetical protein